MRTFETECFLDFGPGLLARCLRTLCIYVCVWGKDGGGGHCQAEEIINVFRDLPDANSFPHPRCG